MSTQKAKGEPFFFNFHLALLILVVGSFGSNAMVNLEALPPVSPIFIIHGIFMLIWYVLVPVQTGLIRRGNPKLHMTLGKWSVALAAGVVLSGILMTLENFGRTADSIGITTVNLFITINFIALYTLAYIRRHNAVQHKRFITYASIAMLLPALGRFAQVMGINPFLSLVFWLIIILIPLIYDLRKIRRLQPATVVGSVLVFLGIVFTLILISSPAWAQFLNANFAQ